MLFTQIIHKSKWTHKFLKISQYLEKYSSTVQPLTYSSWHQENRQKELLIGGGEEVGDGRAKGSSAIGDKQAAISLMPDGWWHGFRFLAGISPCLSPWMAAATSTYHPTSRSCAPKATQCFFRWRKSPCHSLCRRALIPRVLLLFLSLFIPFWHLALLSSTRYVKPLLLYLLPDTLGLK